MIRALIAALLIVLVAGAAAADHGGGLGGQATNPLVTALVWGGATLVAGIAVIAIVTALSRRRSSRTPDA